MKNKIVYIFYNSLIACLFLIFILVVIRVFIFDSYRVDSYSMFPALRSGDYILVNKLILGPRFFINKKKIIRLFKRSHIERGDILVFNSFAEDLCSNYSFKSLILVKRCLGLPGDSLSIENGIYQIGWRKETVGNEANQIRLQNTPDSLLHNFIAINRWNVKNLGPIYIPKKNETLEITLENIALYKAAIEYETQVRVTIKDSICYLNNVRFESYKFRQNYYFMGGDYVFDSYDSRYWGLLPEDYIIGKATLIYFSRGDKKRTIAWDRIGGTL